MIEANKVLSLNICFRICVSEKNRNEQSELYRKGGKDTPLRELDKMRYNDTTVWKYKNFSVTQILREINSCLFRSLLSVKLAQNFDYVIFGLKTCKIMSKFKNQRVQVKGSKVPFINLDFTKNLICSKIMEFSGRDDFKSMYDF